MSGELIALNPHGPPLVVGRNPGPKGWLLLDRSLAARQFQIESRADKFFLVPLAKDPVFLLNNKELWEKRELDSGDRIRIGTQQLRFLQFEDGAYITRSDPSAYVATIHLVEGKNMNIGRSSTCDLHADLPGLPWKALKLQAENRNWWLQDRDGKTYPLEDGRQHFWENFQLERDGSKLHLSRPDQKTVLKCSGLSVTLSGKTILHNLEFPMNSGELLGILGLSGDGKSTLLKALAGNLEPSTGEIRLGGQKSKRSSLRQSVGYLAQDAPLHGLLNFSEALEDSANIRREAGGSPEQENLFLKELLSWAGLEVHASTAMKDLSGGEQKRAALALELVSEARVLLLDEVFSGLDPLRERELTTYLLRLCEKGMSLALSTHSYAHLDRFHKLLILHEGRQVFYGRPRDALTFFNTASFEDILSRLRQQSPADNARQYQNSPLSIPSEKSEPTRAPIHEIEIRKSSPFSTLLRRNCRKILRDRGRLLFTLLQPPVIALLLLSLFNTDSSRWTIALALTLTAVWFGLIGASQAIVDERRELAADFRHGIGQGNYLFSHWIPTTFVALVQSLGTALPVLFGCDMEIAWPALFIGFGTAALSASAVGLLVSTLASTRGQALAVLPLLLIPQVMFAGALIPPEEMSFLADLLSRLVHSRWFYFFFREVFTGGPPPWQELFPPVATGLIAMTAATLAGKWSRYG